MYCVQCVHPMDDRMSDNRNTIETKTSERGQLGNS